MLKRCAHVGLILVLVLALPLAGPVSAAPRMQTDPDGQTAFQRALQTALTARAAAGQPVPDRAQFAYEVTGAEPAPANARTIAAPGRQVRITSRTVIEFASPVQAGYDRWPTVAVPATLPAGAEGALAPGDYTSLIAQALAASPAVAQPAANGLEPRTYTFEETYLVTYPSRAEVEAWLPATPLAETMSRTELVLGFTYLADLDYDLAFKWETLGITLAEGRAGFELRWGLGLRLPVEVSLAAPEPLFPEQTYTLATALRPRDFAAADYLRLGAPPENGNEFVLRFSFFIGARLRLLGREVLRWYLESDFDASRSFTTPFGPGLTFPLGEANLPPSATGLTFDLAVLNLGIGLILRPELRSERITADWEVLPGSDGEGAGALTYTAADAPVPLGPVLAGDRGPGRDLHLRLSNFRYWFNYFHLKLEAYLAVTVFGFGVESGSAEVADVNLSDLTEDLALGLHPGTPQHIDRALRVAVPAVEVVLTPAEQAAPVGAAVTQTFTVRNAGEQDLREVAVSATACAPAYTGGDGDADGQLDQAEAWTYACVVSAVTRDLANRVSATAVAVLNLQPVQDAATAVVVVADGVVGGGDPAACTELALRTEFANGGEITFDCGGPATIRLTQPLVASGDVTLWGEGLITLDGQRQTRLFEVPAGAGLTLNALTLANGYTSPAEAPAGGGALRNQGSAVVMGVRFVANESDYGGAVHNSGTLSVQASTFTRNYARQGGGALYNAGEALLLGAQIGGLLPAEGNLAGAGGGGVVNWGGTLTIHDSLIAQNHSGNGGGVQNGEGWMALTNTQVISNGATLRGGGLVNFSGGQVVINGGSLFQGNRVYNPTDPDNRNGGGGVFNFEGGTVEVANSVFIDNQARSTFAQNPGAGGALRNLAGGALTVRDSQLIGNAADYGGAVHNSGSLTLAGATLTRNHALKGGGGLYNDGAATVTNCTIGGAASEAGNTAAGEGAEPAALSGTGGGGLLNWGAGTLAVADSVIAHNLAGNGGGVQNGGEGVATFTNTQLVGNAAAVRGGAVVNYGPGQVFIRGGSRLEDNVVFATDPGTLVGGGGVYNFDGGRVEIVDSVLANNQTRSTVAAQPAGGGAVRNLAGGTLVLRAAQVTGNLAQYGGGLHNSGQAEVLASTLFTANTAEVGGGAIYNDGTLWVDYSRLGGYLAAEGNTAVAGGGGLVNWGGAATLVNNTLVAFNRAENGGGLQNGGPAGGPVGELTVLDSTVRDNTASLRGGGLVNFAYGRAALTRTAFSRNAANGPNLGGGAVFNAANGAVLIEACRFDANTALGGPGGGGAVRNLTGGTVTAAASTFVANRADYGGALHNEGALTVAGGSGLFENEALGGGGALANFKTGEAAVLDSTLGDNRAQDGGAVANGEAGALRLERVTLAANRATHGGAVSTVNTAQTTLVNATLSGNTAEAGGGLVVYDAGRVTVSFSTLADNAAAAGASVNNFGAAAVEVDNSVLAGLGGANCVGAVRNNGHNLQAPDQTCFAAAPQPPLVGPLGLLAGERLATRPLLVGSPAIDGAPAGTCPATDARGLPRAYGAACDIGAYELEQATATAPAGAVTSVALTPIMSGPLAMLAELTHSAAASAPAALTVAAYTENPAPADLLAVGVGAVDVRLQAAHPADTLGLRLYYPNTLTGGLEAGLRLWYFTGTAWAPVRGSGGALPVFSAVDNQDGTASGGRVMVTLDATSTPAVTDLTGTLLTLTPGGVFNTTVLDNFNRRDGGLPTTWAGTRSGYRNVAQRLDVGEGGPLYWNAATFGADQMASVSLVQSGLTDAHQSLLLKVQGSGWTKGALAVYYLPGAGEVGLEAYVPNKGWTTLAVFPAALKPGDRLTGVALADGTLQAYVNGVFLGQANAGKFFVGKAGRIGLWFFQAREAVLDDFGGGTLTR